MADERVATRDALMALLSGGASSTHQFPGASQSTPTAPETPSGMPASLPNLSSILGRTPSGGVADLLSSVLGSAAAPMVQRSQPSLPAQPSQPPSAIALLSLLQGGSNVDGASITSGTKGTSSAIEATGSLESVEPKSPVIKPGRGVLSTGVFTYVDPFLEARLNEESEEALDVTSLDEGLPAQIAPDTNLARTVTLEEDTTQSEDEMAAEQDTLQPQEVLRSPSFSSTGRSPTPSTSSPILATIKAALTSSTKAAEFRNATEASGGTNPERMTGYRLPEDDNLGVRFDVRKPYAEGISGSDLPQDKIALMPMEFYCGSGNVIAGSGSYIAYAVRGGKVRVIEVETAAKDMVSELGTTVIDLAFAPSSNVMVAVGSDSKLLVLELSPAAALSESLKEEQPRVISKVVAQFNGEGNGRFVRSVWGQGPSGTMLAVAGNRGEVWLWNITEMMETSGDNQDSYPTFSEEDDEGLPGTIAVYQSVGLFRTLQRFALLILFPLQCNVGLRGSGLL